MGVRMAMNRAHHRFSLGFGICLSALLLVAGEPRFAAQDDATRLRVTVNLVQLNVAVTDREGNYVGRLRPEDFQMTEDKIQKISRSKKATEPCIP